jgi:hypothetical protein
MFTEKTAFEARVTNNFRDDLINVTGRYQASSADADCDAGRLVIRNGQLPCEGFTGVKNENAWYMNDATSTTNAGEVVYAANTYEVQRLQGKHGNMYAVGTETLGLGIPAGRDGTFTKIVFDGDHAYRFGIGNVNAEISTNTFFTIDAGKLKPAAAAPTANGALYFKLLDTGKFTEGTTASFEYVDVQACKVYA